MYLLDTRPWIVGIALKPRLGKLLGRSELSEKAVVVGREKLAMLSALPDEWEFVVCCEVKTF